LSLTLCCCGRRPRIKFGFARHRRNGFIPRFALPSAWAHLWPSIFANLPDLFPSVPYSRDGWSFYDVYRTLTVEESFTYSADPAAGYSGRWQGEIARRGGAFTLLEQTNPGLDGFSGTPSETFTREVPTHRYPPTGGVPPDYSQSVEVTATSFTFRDQWTPLTGGLFSRQYSRTLSGLVTAEEIEEDMHALLEAINFDAFPWPGLQRARVWRLSSRGV